MSAELVKWNMESKILAKPIDCMIYIVESIDPQWIEQLDVYNWPSKFDPYFWTTVYL